MNLREKYGEWGLILGATEGVGKAFCEKIAAGGMNVVMVGRREEKLNVLAGEIRETYGVETKVVRADFSQPGAAETVFAATEGLDMGFMSYVACLHSFGKIQDTPWEKHEAMINVNVVTFLKCFQLLLLNGYTGIVDCDGEVKICWISSCCRQPNHPLIS